MTTIHRALTAATLQVGAACCVVALSLVSYAGAPPRGADDPLKPVILIPPFENQSKYHENISYEVAASGNPNSPKRRYAVDRYTEAPRSLCEDMLTNLEGVTVTERQRVDTLLVESEFGLTPMVDPAKAVKLAKMAGANLIVMGTIVDIREESRSFRGYGIATENMEILCQIRVRLLDMETGNVKFSKVVKGSKTYSKSSFGGTKSSDRNFAAIEATLEKLGADSQFRAAILKGKPDAVASAATDGVVEVDFSPVPENCDIEIDGKYVGGSPLKRRLQAGKEYKIRISKGGYTDWQGVIAPEAGLRITRALDKSR